MHPARHPIAWGQVEGVLALPAPVPPWPGHQDRQPQVSFGEGLSERSMGKTPSALSGTSPKSTTKSFDVNQSSGCGFGGTTGVLREGRVRVESMI
jgi:hypothetical protein